MLKTRATQQDELLSSKLFDQDSFYKAFMDDLSKAKRQVIIESPFITLNRVKTVQPILKKLRRKGIDIIVNTKPPEELDTHMAYQANCAVAQFQAMGITVLYTAGHHRKLAIIDGAIAWEGSLNILSQYDSCEFMRRTYSVKIANATLNFVGLYKWSA